MFGGMKHMKKRILSLFFVLCMVLSVSVTVSFAEETETFTPACTREAHSEGDESGWLPLGANLKLMNVAASKTSATGYYLEPGNYYVDETNLGIDKLVYINGDVNICLNGNTISYTTTNSNMGIFNMYRTDFYEVNSTTVVCAKSDTASLTICDHNAANAAGKITISDAVTTGKMSAVRTTTANTINIQAGTITGFLGAGISLANGGTLNMYGGEISGNGKGGGAGTSNTATAGGIWMAHGTLNIKGGTITKNAAALGGGIAVYSSASTSATATKDATLTTKVNISGGEISDNTATDGAGIYVRSDAYVKGSCNATSNVTLNITGGTILKNTASTTGGGIYVTKATKVDTGCTGTATSTADLSMSGGTITGNAANGTTAATGGGGIYVGNATLNVTGGEIYDNTAPAFGGGIYANDASAVINISGTALISGNNVTGATADYGGGGGVVIGKGKLNMSGGTIRANKSNLNGGGVYVYNAAAAEFNMSGGTITGNTAASGAGLWIGNGIVTLSGDAEITGNTATGGTLTVVTTEDNPETTDVNEEVTETVTLPAYGGGIYHTTSKTLTITGGEISGNDAANGGGIYQTKGTIAISGGTITDNDAVLGGGIYVEAGTMNLSGGTISANNAVGTSSALAYGGGIYKAAGTLTVTGSAAITANTVSQPKAHVSTATQKNTYTFGGGGLYSKDGNTAISGGTIFNNTVETVTYDVDGFTQSYGAAGGGIFVHGGTTTLSGSALITGNEASKNKSLDGAGGGGVYVMSQSSKGGAVFEMTGGTISGNTGGRGGGVLARYYGSFNMSDGTISGNTGTEKYGAVCLSNTRMNSLFSGGEIIDQTATYGVRIDARSSATFNGTTVKDNKSVDVYVFELVDTSDSVKNSVTVTSGTLGVILCEGNGTETTKYINAAVNGGTISEITAKNFTDARDSLIISGGRFAAGPSDAYVDTANGCVMVNDGTAGYPYIVGKGYAVDFGETTGGTVEVSPTATLNDAAVIPAGATVTVTAKPDSGYVFTGKVTVNTDTYGTSFVMPADDIEVSADFADYLTEELTIADYADGAPTTDDGYFAGWYKDNNYETAVEDTTGVEKAYAKFVNKAVLGLKKQVKKNTTAGTAALRLVTSVDDINYEKVGFKISYNAGEAVDKFTTKVYETIVEEVGGEAIYSNAAVHFHTDSQYFATFTIINIPSDAYETTFTVTPYWMTLDGTEVFGVEEEFTIDGLAAASN